MFTTDTVPCIGKSQIPYMFCDASCDQTRLWRIVLDRNHYLLKCTVGYKIKLIMPADQSEERKSAMAAFGAELISVPSSIDGGGMEAARDLAARMQVSSSPAKPPAMVPTCHCYSANKHC